MIHDGEGPKNGFFRERDNLCRKILLDKIRAKNPDFSASRLQKMLDKDTYLWPAQALELGLIDEII
jgi:ATP-dependent protease ClpP protease subunit